MGFSVGGKEKETMQSDVSAYVVKSKCNNQLPEAVECYDKDLQTSFYLFKLGVLILES